jgi:hypothetical protein
MKYADVVENVRRLLDDRPPQDVFIYELLLAYGKPKASITRLKQGTYNQSKVPGEVLWKKEVYFKAVGRDRRARRDGQLGDLSLPQDLFAAIEELKTSKGTQAHNPRFLFVTDFEQILAIDRKTNDTLDIKFQGLETHFDFFLPWAGMEKYTAPNETLADIKAAEKMAKLFDAIKLDNPRYMRDDAHSMNVFLGRLLFCLFAEDTGIFPENAVTNAIASHTAVNGSDLDAFFKQLFDWLDTPDNKRKLTTEGRENHRGEASCSSVSSSAAGGKNSFLSSMQGLPYVNGGLFREHFDIPEFSAKSRRMIIESGSLNWSEINPDIFGSMFQAVIDPEERHNLGQHYTSVTNIMKVIEPLFLNDLREQFEVAAGRAQNKKRVEELHQLLERIWNLKIFDPACGSGNFLIIAYKELRRLEMEIFETLNEFPVSKIRVDQFYGIEIADFACETAVLALWLAEHQMNLEYEKRFKRPLTSLPLKAGANIVQANACQKDWEEVCPRDLADEVYVLGNPPYLGARMQNKKQKADMAAVFGSMKGANSLDYIACWFFKASQYIRGINAQFAFVSTNSVCQGEQVALLWPSVLKEDLEIGFAHQSFKWANNAKGSAGVTCVVVGVRNPSGQPKNLFHGQHVASVKNINSYLVNAGNAFICRRSLPASNIPPMKIGNKPIDDGNYLFSREEKDEFIRQEPLSKEFFFRWYGSQEFIKGIERWCLLAQRIPDGILAQMPMTQQRIENVREFRARSKSKPTREIADIPTRFHVENFPESQFFVVPKVSSERREYIPMNFLPDDAVASDLLNVVADATPDLLGIISSRMHMAWMRAVAGRLETRYRYSAGIVYNNFPIPDLTEEQKQTITMHVAEVMEEREKHSQKTMAQLYDPDKMPDGLREAHHNLDLAVDRIYRAKPFTSDEERLEHLFKLYEEMTAKEKLV